MKNPQIIPIALLSIIIMYCGKPIDITDQYELDENSNRIPKIAFEGRISNQIDSNYVKIRRVVGIRSSKSPIIENASVTVSDNRGNSELLTYVGYGRYQCLSLLGINDGRVYTMTADVEGKTYSAISVMPNTPLPFDSVISVADEENEGKFKVLIYAKVHTEFDEYYLFQNFVNDTLQNGPGDIDYADNSILNGKINGFEVANNLEKGVVFRYKFYSLTKEAFKFYEGISSQLNNDGGVFTTPPANVKGNIARAGGLFQGTYFLTDTITVR